MPSPIGHALGGVIVAALSRSKGRDPGRSTATDRFPVPGSRFPSAAVAACAVAAVLPDADFLWSRHNMETHSLGAAVLAGLAVLAFTGGRARRLALLVALAWASHVLFDWLGSDDTPPLGVMALWPLTSDFYFAHAYAFEAISRRTHLPNFWPHNLWAVAKEVLMLAPVAGVVWVLRRRARPR